MRQALKYGLMALALTAVFGGVRAGARRKDPRPISDNGKPLIFQIVHASVTREPQSREQVTSVQYLVDLSQAASTGRGTLVPALTYSYEPMPLTASESFLIVQFNVSNVRRRLKLSPDDVQLADVRGSVHQALGSPGQKEKSWYPLSASALDPRLFDPKLSESNRLVLIYSVAKMDKVLEPKLDNHVTWIFTVPTDAVSGAVIRFQNGTYPLSVTLPLP